MPVLKDYIKKAYDFVQRMKDYSKVILESLNLNRGSEQRKNWIRIVMRQMRLQLSIIQIDVIFLLMYLHPQIYLFID